MECPYRGVLEEQVRDEEEQLGKPQAGKKVHTITITYLSISDLMCPMIYLC